MRVLLLYAILPVVRDTRCLVDDQAIKLSSLRDGWCIIPAGANCAGRHGLPEALARNEMLRYPEGACSPDQQRAGQRRGRGERKLVDSYAPPPPPIPHDKPPLLGGACGIALAINSAEEVRAVASANVKPPLCRSVQHTVSAGKSSYRAGTTGISALTEVG